MLEFFPATPQALVPTVDGYRLEANAQGNLQIRNLRSGQCIVLEPISPAGNPTTQVCCDFCHHSAPRHYLQMFRVEIPDSHGRRFRYVSLCRNCEACEGRRINDQPLRRLIERLGL